MADSGFSVQKDTVAAYIHEYFPNIIRGNIGFTAEIGAGLSHSGKCQRASGADAQFYHRMTPGSLDQISNIPVDTVMDKDSTDFFLHLQQAGPVCCRPDLFNGILGNAAFEYSDLLIHIRISHGETDSETVKLRLGEKLCSGRAGRVLSGNNNKWFWERMGHTVFADLDGDLFRVTIRWRGGK